MANKTVWTKARAQKALAEIAGDVAEMFGIPAPVVFQPDHRTGADWDIRFDTVEVWTKAGRAEMAVDISARFAHLYFRFDDPARAESLFGMSRQDQRLNRFSGKWNHHGTPDSWSRDGKACPETSIDVFRAELRRDFRKVAERSPDPKDVAAYREKKSVGSDVFRLALSTEN